MLHGAQSDAGQSAAAIARVLTEYLASAVGDPAARRTAEDVVRRAGELKIAGAAGMPAQVAINIRYLNALGRSADPALRIAGDPEVQALFSLLTCVSPNAMALTRQLIETEIYRRRRSSNGRRG